MILDETQDNNYLNQIRNGTLQQGLGIGCDLDNHYLFKSNEFDVFAGHANVGKTDWVIWHRVALSVKHSLSFLIFSSENRIGGLKRKIIEYKTGRNLEDLNEEDFNEANRWMNFKFKFVDTSQLYTARELIQVFVDNKDMFDGVVLDPYNSLKREGGQNGHEYDYEIASEFRLFCKNYNKNLMIVAHGVTEALRKKHPQGDLVYIRNIAYDVGGHPIPLSAADIEGGGKWVNRCDNFIVGHRYTQHEEKIWSSTLIHVRKIKETETGGRPTVLDKPIPCEKWHQTFSVNGKNPLQQPNEIHDKTNAILEARKKEDKEIDEWKITPEDDLPF